MNLVCTSCIRAAEDETWSAGTGGAPADLCMSLGAGMSAHDCIRTIALTGAVCACSYPHDGGLSGNDPIRVLELGLKYATTHGHNAIAAEGLHRAVSRALFLLAGPAKGGTVSSDELLAIYNGLQARKEPNTKNLADIRCPKCGSYEPFDITFEATYTVSDDIPPTPCSHAWGLDSDIVCAACGHKGIVGEFQQNLTAGEIMHLEGKEGKGRTTCTHLFKCRNGCTNFERDFEMRTSDGNEAVSKLVCCTLEAIEQGRRSSEVRTMLAKSIEVIHDEHSEVTSVTVRDRIFNALAPAYRERYKTPLPYNAVAERPCSSCGWPQCKHAGRGECP